MIIKVRVTPNSKAELVQKLSPSEYAVKVRERATEGKANAATVALLSSYLNVKKSRVSIIKGARSREKLVEVSDA